MENKYKNIKIGVVEDYPTCQQAEKCSSLKDLIKNVGAMATYIALNIIEMEEDFRFDVRSMNGKAVIKKVDRHTYAYLKEGSKIYSIK